MPLWRADVVPHTEHWASLVLVVDLVEGQDERIARAMREALVDVLVSSTDGTEVGIVRASESAEVLVEPVAMATGRAAAIDRIWGTTLSGERNMRAAMRRALALSERNEADSNRRGVVVLASEVDVSIDALIEESSIATDHVYVVAYGQGDHEKALAELEQSSSGEYLQARGPEDLRQRLGDARRTVEGMSLVASGVVEVDAAGHAQVDMHVGGRGIFARFTTYGAPLDAVSVLRPDGERIDARIRRSRDIRLAQVGDRVSIGDGAAARGSWRLSVDGLPPGTVVPYEVETFFDADAYAEASVDLDAEEGMRIGYQHQSLPPPTRVTATVVGPDGRERAVDLAPAPEQNALACCLEHQREVHLEGPMTGGSHLITVRVEGGEGEAAYDRAVRFGKFVWPAVDSDGDGIRDRVEVVNGLDPENAADGAADHDGDGLSTSRELSELATSPGLYDTDGGRESDGSELTAGRDPLDRADDRPPAPCVSPDSLEGPYRPQENAPPALELEALLPDRILGRRPLKQSILGTPLLHPQHPGWLWTAFIECANGFEPTLEVAYASTRQLGGLALVAVRMERADSGDLSAIPATELVDIFLHRLSPGSEDSMRPRTIEVDGRSATITETGYLLYPHDDVLFMVMNLVYGYCSPADCGLPTPPDLEALARDLLPKLPGPEDGRGREIHQ